MKYNGIMINDTLIEICVGNLDDAMTASRYPIDRIELNSALELGGLTPSLETLKYLKQRTDKKICCMVRPRGGDFHYTENEFEVMLKDAENLLNENADGIVFGFLKEDKTVDIGRTKRMADLIHSRNKEAVFHKAFDEIDDLDAACAQLIDCHIDRILTSGKAIYPDILKGCEVIHDLYLKYGKQIQLLPGGGVRVHNIQDVLKISKTGQIHMSSKTDHPGGYSCLDEEQLKQLLEQIRTFK